METENIGNISVYKSSDKKSWIAQLAIGRYDNGRIKYKRFKSDIQKNAKELAEEYLRGEYTNGKSGDTLVRLYMDEYMFKTKKGTIKPTSFDRIIRSLESQIYPRIGGYQMKDITRDILQTNLINSLTQDKYSHSTIKKSYSIIKEIFAYATEIGDITQNPQIGVVLPSVNLFSKKQMRILTENEIIKYIQQADDVYADGIPKYKYGSMAVLPLYTGLRRVEVVALKWRDVDFDNKILSVSSNVSKTYNYGEGRDKRRVVVVEQNTPKTLHSNRIVPLNTAAIALLKKLKVNKKCNSDYIINNSDMPLNPQMLSQTSVQMAIAAGIFNYTGLHTLKHTFASTLIRKGADIKAVSEILGHANVKITYDNYIHLLAEQKFDTVELMNYTA